MAGSATYRFGQFVLDPRVGLLRHDRQTIHVEPRAFALLCYLVEHCAPGRRPHARGLRPDEQAQVRRWQHDVKQADKGRLSAAGKTMPCPDTDVTFIGFSAEPGPRPRCSQPSPVRRPLIALSRLGGPAELVPRTADMISVSTGLSSARVPHELDRSSHAVALDERVEYVIDDDSWSATAGALGDGHDGVQCSERFQLHSVRGELGG